MVLFLSLLLCNMKIEQQSSSHVKQLIAKFPLRAGGGGVWGADFLFYPAVIIQIAAQKQYNSCFI